MLACMRLHFECINMCVDVLFLSTHVQTDNVWVLIKQGLTSLLCRTFFIDTKSLLLSWEKWHDVVTKTEGL